MPRKSTVLCSPYGTSQTGTLLIERNLFEEVINYAKAAALEEVCGFLLVRKESPSLYRVLEDSLHIPEQRTAAGYSETRSEGEIAQMDLEEQYDEDPNVFRLLWHSHVHGGASFSSTDTATHQRMATTSAFDAMFFMVVNTRGQASANLEVYRPFRIGTQLRLVVLENELEADLTPYRAELAVKCQPMPKRTYVPPALLNLEEDSEHDNDPRGIDAGFALAGNHYDYGN